MSLLNKRQGDRVCIEVPNGIGRNGVEFKRVWGRVVMAFDDRLVLNLGGKHGQPAVAHLGNIVHSQRAK